MSQLEPNKLKVAELRSELTARNLPTTGLKKDLVKRLEDALMGIESDTKVDMDNDNKIEEAGDKSETNIADEADVQDDLAMDDDEPVPTHVAMAKDDNLKRKMSIDEGNEVGADGMAMETDEPEKSEMPHMSGEGQGKLAPTAEVTDAFFIKNLERPLTIFRINELLAAFGTVKDAWLNSIKTRGYVSFATKAEAESAFNGVNGTRFPPDHGKIIECGFITKERMKQLISDEDRMSDVVRDTDLMAVQNDGSNCGISLISKVAKGNNPAKKPRGNGDKAGESGSANKDNQTGKGANKPAAATSVSIASTANGKSTSHHSQSGTSADRARATPPPAKTDTQTRKTKTQPSIVYRPLTNEEVATKKQQQ
ncbi:hypothetical protein EV175_000817 [Coemansia sp. RSA 1933]|nr:hypothetical protein EV175_000817 [Coemansia sp. RSA 1933]